MGKEIILKVVLTIVGIITTGAVGYMTAKINQYKEKEKERENKDKQQELALKCLLRSAITKIYYKYMDLGYIPQFERENVIYMHEQYKSMDGNSYIDEIYPEILKLPVKK